MSRPNNNTSNSNRYTESKNEEKESKQQPSPSMSSNAAHLFKAVPRWGDMILDSLGLENSHIKTVKIGVRLN